MSEAFAANDTQVSDNTVAKGNKRNALDKKQVEHETHNRVPLSVCQWLV